MRPELMPYADGRSLRVLTWHVHGGYLQSLVACGVPIYLPVGRDVPGYGGRAEGFTWPDNVIEVDATRVRDLALDAVITQSRQNWERDRLEILSPEQLRRVPVVHIEHDPPREHPTDTRHYVDDPSALIVHVAHFNRLMWDSGDVPSTVIEHGVDVPPQIRYRGDLERGIVAINGIGWRGRRLGLDLYLAARERVPLDLVGLESEAVGGLGPIAPSELPGLMARYRFYYHPVRWTSLGLTLLQAMAVGLPPVALATTESVEAIHDGESGYLSTDPEVLLRRMEELLSHPARAAELGSAARQVARSRYAISRFAAEWRVLLHRVATRGRRAGVHVPHAVEDRAVERQVLGGGS